MCLSSETNRTYFTVSRSHKLSFCDCSADLTAVFPLLRYYRDHFTTDPHVYTARERASNYIPKRFPGRKNISTRKNNIKPINISHSILSLFTKYNIDNLINKEVKKNIGFFNFPIMTVEKIQKKNYVANFLKMNTIFLKLFLNSCQED